MLKKIEGIVIRSTDYGESNKIITIYSRDSGKIGMMARGAKKPNSRLSSISQLFTYGHYLYRSYKGLGTLSQGETIHSFRSIREDLFKTAYAAYIVELADKLTEDFVASPTLFNLLYYSLYFINENFDEEVITFIYETKMLAFAGITPQLHNCAHCTNAEEEYVAFSVKEGGYLCHRCLHADPHYIRISRATAKLLPIFLTMDIKRLGQISLKKSTRSEIKRVLDEYYEAYSGLYLKSKRFLSQLEKFEQ
ncbi:DNA repair protein RecO [Pueribacillus sp. YX66]|uniref:DNA repair protein RecO n=1 Tax=Pueribacillus sp. YX66 TaxID=3229242 RepID=UPI00358D196F